MVDPGTVARARIRARRTDRKKIAPGREVQPQPAARPGRQPDGGQWTSDGGGYSYDAEPAGGITDTRVLSDATPDNLWTPGAQLAALDENKPGQNPGGQPENKFPSVPEKRPEDRTARMGVVRAIGRFLANVPLVGLAANMLIGAENNAAWLQDYHATLLSYRDPPRSLEELQAAVSDPRPGYDKHHIVEKTLAERFGFSRSQINDADNLVLIPRMRHWDITGWYMTPNREFGGLSPREYLQDKDWTERRRVGLFALREFKVLER